MIIYPAENIASQCGNRTYAFTVRQNSAWADPNGTNLSGVTSRQACMDICLGYTKFVCRSVVFHTKENICHLSRLEKLFAILDTIIHQFSEKLYSLCTEVTQT